MVWSSTSPDGTKSVKANETSMLANTTYIETELNKDHFFNIGSDEDGHHKFAQMPKYTDGAALTPTSPTLDTGMDLAYFARLKTAVEAPAAAAQNIQSYARDASGILQLLGMRACGVFDVNQATGAITRLYTHNVKVGGITSPVPSVYQIEFDTAVPSTSYMVLAMGSRYNADGASNYPLVVSLVSGTTMATKTVDLFALTTSDVSGTGVKPLQVSFVVFGG